MQELGLSNNLTLRYFVNPLRECGEAGDGFGSDSAPPTIGRLVVAQPVLLSKRTHFGPVGSGQPWANNGNSGAYPRGSRCRRQHADVVILAPIARHLTASRKMGKVVGAVPVIDR